MEGETRRDTLSLSLAMYLSLLGVNVRGCDGVGSSFYILFHESDD